jgi:tetratricopeptide (TPR) repeat protein
MRTKFYIHIGVHKTGTKSIQHMLADNRSTLLTYGINSFPGDRNHGPTLISLLADYPHGDTRNIRKHLDTPEKAVSFNESKRHEIVKTLRRNRAPKMVISGEGLSGLWPAEIERLKEMLAPYASSYRIIVYVRDPYEYANSAYLQWIKSGSILGEEDRIPLTNYRRKLERYINAFGRENVDIRIFNPQRFVGGDLVSDFLVALGESPDVVQSLDVVRANVSMSHEAALILSETNREIPILLDRSANRERAFGFHSYVVEIEGEKFTIDPNAYLKHEPNIAADIEWLHQLIGESVFGQAKPRPASSPRWSEATAGSIKRVVDEMAVELRRLVPDVKAWPAVPPALEWLRDAYDPGAPGTPQTPAPAPQFAQADIRALGCFLHAIALMIQRRGAEHSAYRHRFLVWVNPREAENHYREVVRLNPDNARAQYHLSQAHLLRGHFGEARRAAEAASRLAPERALLRYWLKLTSAVERRFHKAPAEQPMPLRSRHGPGRRPAQRQGPKANPAARGDRAASRPQQR